MSKYQEVVEDIIRKIENNEYTDKLPTEDQLIEQYQVSRNTIRNATRITMPIAQSHHRNT